jgi:hypothetical protein
MEDWKVTMIAAAIAAFCVIVLAIIFSRRNDRKKEEPVGTLHIANDPEDGPYLFLELDKKPEELYSKSTLVFRVDNIPYETFGKTAHGAGMSASEAADAIGRLANF